MNEIFSTIWSISDKLRGVLSSEDFKNYVLCMLVKLDELDNFNLSATT